MAVDVASTIELRSYQEECVQLVLDAYRKNPSGRELIVLPCAAGKTVIFSHIIASLAREHGTLGMVVAHMDALLDQAINKYLMVKPDAVIGKVGSGVHQYGGEVTVTSVATVSKPQHLHRLKTLYGTGRNLIIVIDEAHLSAADSYKRILAALPDAFVLLVTATPFRLDGKSILDKAPLFTRTIEQMVTELFLCNVKAIAIKTEESLDNVASLGGDFNEKELDLAINTPARNKRIVQAYQEHTPGKRALVFAVTVAHAEAIAYAFQDAGIPAASISSSTPIPHRNSLYQQFEQGVVLVLVSVMVLSIGFDSPRAEVAIMARPTQSKALYIQQAGRIMRLAPGKKIAILLDITDNCMRHRLQPQSFGSAIKHLRPDETLLSALAGEEDERAEKEATEKRALIRKLNERRSADQHIDLFGLPDWQEKENGMFILEVGPQKHRIALVPRASAGWAQLYDVFARLAPTFSGQRWASGQTLDGAMQLAEKKARALLDGKSILVDQSAPWRLEPPSDNQKKYLAWKKLPMPTGMTKGEAADLIDKHNRMLEQKKAEKEARKAAKEQVSA